MNKLRLVLSSLLLSLVLLGSVPLASAHVLKQSNGSTVVLHIAPLDNPAAGEKTTLELLYGNALGNFSLSNYTVGYQLTLANKAIAQGTAMPAYFGAATESSLQVTFPRIGVYNLVVAGTPINPTVANFQVSYDIRVDHIAATTTSPTHKRTGPTLVLLAGAGVLLLGGLAGGWWITKHPRLANYRLVSKKRNSTTGKRRK